MARAERFEDLFVWQKARLLAKELYCITRKGAFARDVALAGQIQRAAVSILSNIAEGFERQGAGEFLHFLSVAKGSCGEIRAQLYVALDVGYLEEGEFARLRDFAAEVSRLIERLRASVAASRQP